MIFGLETLHVFTPQETRTAIAAAAGSFCALAVSGPGGWWQRFALFSVGQVTAYYWTASVLLWLMWGDIDRPVGFIFGACGMALSGALIRFTRGLSDDPLGTFGRAIKAWKGRSE